MFCGVFLLHFKNNYPQGWGFSTIYLPQGSGCRTFFVPGGGNPPFQKIPQGLAPVVVVVVGAGGGWGDGQAWN